jgi:hypothetical protein
MRERGSYLPENKVLRISVGLDHLATLELVRWSRPFTTEYNTNYGYINNNK